MKGMLRSGIGENLGKGLGSQYLADKLVKAQSTQSVGCSEREAEVDY